MFDDDIFEDFGDDSLLPYPRAKVSRIDANESIANRGRSKRSSADDTSSQVNPKCLADPDTDRPWDASVQDRIADELRSAVRRHIPRLPGVYGMLDLRGRLIYVGKSKCLKNRLLSYFLPHNEEEKSGRIVQSTQSIVWEVQPSEFAALLREQYLIRHFQPRFNVQGMPKRQRPVFLCLGKPPAETLYVSHLPDSRAIACQGPLLGSGRVRRAVEVLNRIFSLRDCSNQTPFSFTDQLQLFDIQPRPGCLRLELQTCLGPCAGACNRAGYQRQVQEAQKYLTGENDDPVHMLEQQMNQAAQRMHFEQAARLRDDLKHVRWLSRRLDHFAEARQKFSFVYPVAGVDGRDCWYIIRQGELCHTVAAPTTAANWKKNAKLIEELLTDQQTIGQKATSRPETVALISGWFRSNRGELKQVFAPHAIPQWTKTRSRTTKAS
jgi:excinuclease ABC subunit C